MTEMSEREDSADTHRNRYSEDDDAPPSSGAPGKKLHTLARSRLSTTFLGIGASVAVALRALYGFTVFLPGWQEDTHPQIAMMSWIVLFFVILLCIVVTSFLGSRMPNWLFFLSVMFLALVVILDLWSIWGLHNIGASASAGLTAIMALLLFLTIRRRGEILVASGFLGLILIIAIVVNTPLTPETLPAQIAAIGLSLVPVLIGVYVTGGFRTMVARELDRVLAQSTLTSPRFSVGFLASEELARLDFAAERLLNAVATGTMQLPLSTTAAARAGTIATQLRFQLLEARRETWLHHAITESPQLARSVHLRDATGLAGLLAPRQREGLLEAMWLFVGSADAAKHQPTLTITVDPSVLMPEATPSNMLGILISLAIDGTSRNQIDVSMWDSIGKLGKFRDSVQNNRLRIDIECVVDNPAEM